MKKPKIKTMDLILLLVGIAAAVFTVIMIVLFCIYQSIPDTLCERFYTCIIGECGVMGVMQAVKIRYQKSADSGAENEESEDLG